SLYPLEPAESGTISIGLATLRSCVRMGLGVSPSGVVSAGNGVAMRAAIVGVFFHDPYAQLKGSWSCMKNGKPLFHHVLQCVSCWKKELPDGDCRQGRRDYTKSTTEDEA